MSATMTEAQRAYEARRARKHGMTLEQWLRAKAGRAQAESGTPRGRPEQPASSETTALPRTDEEVRALVPASMFHAAAQLVRQGCVERIRQAGAWYTVHLRDLHGKRLRSTFHLITQEGRTTLAGTCGCGTHTVCAHMAAGLLAHVRWLRRNPQSAPAASVPAAPAGRRPSPVSRPEPAPPAPSPATEWLAELREIVAVEGAQAGRPSRLIPTRWSIETDEADRSSAPAPEPGDQTVFYFLSRSPRPGNRSVPAFGAAQARIRKDGTPGAEREFSIWALSMIALRYGLDEDIPIGEAIARLSGNRLSREEQRRTLIDLYRQVLATGRCHWLNRSGVRLRPGPIREMSLAWRPDTGGRMALSINPPSPDIEIIGGDVQMYVDTAEGLVGPVQVGLSDELTRVLLTGPLLPTQRRGEVMAGLHEIAASVTPPLTLPEPPKRFRKDRRQGAPVPVLRLLTAPLETARGTHKVEDLVRLTLRYDDVEIDPRNRAPRFERLDEDRLTTVHRDLGAERAAEETLEALGFKPVGATGRGHTFRLATRQRRAAWPDLVHRRLPALAQQGWEIVVDESFRYRVLDAEETWIAQLWDAAGRANPGSGQVPDDEDGDDDAALDDAGWEQGWADWLSLSLDITVDGERVPLLPILVQALRRYDGDGRGTTPAAASAGLEHLIAGETAYLDLPDGRTVALPADRLRRFVNVLVELYEPGALDGDGRLRLATPHAAGLAMLEDAVRLRWFGSGAFQDLIQRLKSFQGLEPVAPPAGLRATLRPYQCQGLAWLQFLRDFGFGGVLADDMGLGKTPQALAHILCEKEAGRLDRPCLVVCPTTLVGNWLSEAARFAPDLKVLALHGPTRADRVSALPEADLVITTYPLLTRDEAILLEQDWHLVILDEAQAIKNPKAKATLVACRLRARARLCLTGTPIENNLTELWSQFAFVMPGLLGRHRRFRSLYRTPIEKQGDGDRLTGLRTRLRPFILRRTKAEVAADLPEKTEILRTVALNDGQRDLYEAVRLSVHARVQEEVRSKGLARSQIVILDALLKLRQVCCDPRLVKLEVARRTKESAKLDYLMELLPTLLDNGRRVLLFSQFTQMLDLIKAAVTAVDIPFVELRGDTADRATPVRQFQDGAVPLFLISLKAGGTGLNLTAADTVIHYDPWWNPAVERQATDRAHRIGQDKGVFVYKLIAEGTIEERILKMQADKQKLADGVFADGGVGSGSLRPEDLEFLFDPLA